MSLTSRAVCFTLNNYTEDEETAIRDFLSTCRFGIYGREVGAGGTPHLQGYCYGFNARRLPGWKTGLGQRAHIEFAKGSVESNVEYCSKEGDVFRCGEPPVSQAKKGEVELARWERARAAAMAGDLGEVPADIFVRCYRTLKEISKDYMPPVADSDSVTGTWFTGRSGVGKSRRAREECPGAYLKMANKWWDGYQSQECVVLDDLDTGHACLGHHLKIWADRYSFLAETKGGAICIRPKRFVVTSQYLIEDIWEDNATVEALKRRFVVIVIN